MSCLRNGESTLELGVRSCCWASVCTRLTQAVAISAMVAVSQTSYGCLLPEQPTTRSANSSVKASNTAFKGPEGVQRSGTALPIYVEFELIDEKKAAELYGAHIGRDFYAMRIYVTNRLESAEGNISLLAYGESMYAQVRLEKRTESEKSGDLVPRQSGWRPASSVDFSGGVIHDPNAPPEIQSDAAIRAQNGGMPSDSFRIQPYSFVDMFKAACDGSKGRLTNQQFWALATQTMQAVEEVPFGRTISRTIFFSRRPLSPAQNGYVFRISEIYTGSFKTLAPVVANRTAIRRNSP